MRFVRKITAFLKKRPWLAGAAGGLFTIVVGVAAFSGASDELAPAVKQITFTEYQALLKERKIEKATVGRWAITAETKDKQKVTLDHSGMIEEKEVLAGLQAADAKIEFPKPATRTWVDTIWDLVGFAFSMVMGLGMLALIAMVGLHLKGAVKLNWPPVAKGHTVRFSDVAGQDEPKAELEEIKTFLANPAEYARLGAKAPRGVLMVGAPGNGKTLIAKALAGEVGANFIPVSGSDFSAMFIGVGRNRMEKLFSKARRLAPCIIFIDEIDAVARRRNASGSDLSREADTTLNQLLIEMDGFKPAEGVIVIGATNLEETLDPALLRPGRFDRRVYVALPDQNGRRDILGKHVAGKPIDKDVDLMTIARGTPGYSGADLQNLVNEAAVLAAREKASVITAAHFEGARDKLLLGLQRKSLMLDEHERRLIAVHEAGHAVVATLSPASDKVHTATIVPRGPTLGLVMRLPEKDRVSVPRKQLEADLDVAMAGRAAEELVFGEDLVTTGAEADIKYATEIATRMVTRWGMSPAIGMVKVELAAGQSDAIVDGEVRRIVDQAYARAREKLEINRLALDRVTDGLLSSETLSGDEIREMVAQAMPANDPGSEPVAA